jgi:hypothetical protein
MGFVGSCPGKWQQAKPEQENSTMDIAKTAEGAVTEPVSWAKQNPWAFAFLVVVIVVLALHFSARMHTFIVAKAAGGSKLWNSIGKLTGSVAATGATAAAILGVLWLANAGNVHSLHDLVTLLMAGGLSLAAVAFPTTDYCALKDETGLYNSPILVGSSSVEKQFYLRAEQERSKQGFPIKLTDICFAVTARVDQAMDPSTPGPTSGSPLFWDELFQITDSFEIQSPRFGLICERTSISGPVWKHMVEYIGNGYAYSGDDPFATIAESQYACGAADSSTYYFTLYHSYPVMQRYLAKPDETAMFIGFLQNCLLKYRLAASNALAASSAAASIVGGVLVRAGYRYLTAAAAGGKNAALNVPPLAYCRVLKIPANGQIDMMFPQVSNQGPQNTDVSQGERIVAALMLSNNVGLPGAGNWTYSPGTPPTPDDSGLTEIGCEVLGVKFTNNPDMYLQGKLEQTRRSQPTEVGRTLSSLARGFYGVGPYCASWPYTLQGPSYGVPEINLFGVDTACGRNLLGFPFALPSMGTKISKMPRIAGNINVHMRQSNPPVPTQASPGPQHCLYLHTLRDIDGAYAASMLAAAGATGTVTRSVNHNADAAVTSGQASPASYVGIPHVAK